MRLIIAGGREVGLKGGVGLVANAFSALPWKDEVGEIVHGGASGIDSEAGHYFEGKLPVTVMPAEWKKHGRAAGPIRNKQMAEYADALLAIWDGKSRGTRNMIETAERLGLKVFVYQYHSPVAQKEDE